MYLREFAEYPRPDYASQTKRQIQTATDVAGVHQMDWLDRAAALGRLWGALMGPNRILNGSYGGAQGKSAYNL